MSDNFHESHWGQCLELLSHLCQYSNSILLVTGPAGIGKTTMKNALMYMEKQNFSIREVIATKDFSSHDLSLCLAQDQADQSVQDILLLIDDAQNLSIEVIAVLLQLKQKAAIDGKLRIVLFATPELEHRILRSVLKDDFSEHVHTIEIEPLTATEVEAFLMQQWRKSNDSESPFDRVKCKKIHSLSGGIPAKVQQIAKDFMHSRDVSRAKSQMNNLSPVMVGITVSFGVIFCVLALLWPAADDKIIAKGEATITQPLPIAKQEEIQSPEAIVEKPVDVVATTQEVETAHNELVQPTVENNYEEKLTKLEQQLNELQQQLIKEQEARRSMEAHYKNIVALQTTPKAQATKSVKRNAIKTKKALSFTKHEKQILALPSKNYTLQLLCMNDENKVQAFIKQYNLQQKTHYYKSNFKGKDWYILVYGNYANKADAQAALQKLPPALKKLHPWAREYTNIHASLKKRTQDE